MDNFTTINVAAARLGAACSAADSPWTNALLAAGANHALERKLPTIGGTPGVRRAASWHVHTMSGEQAQFAALRGAELRPTTVRKPMNVQTTRIDAVGYGAMGPHPERERLA